MSKQSNKPTSRPASAMKEVKAIQSGFYGGIRRREGAQFSIPVGVKLGKWMEEVNPPKPEAEQAKE